MVSALRVALPPLEHLTPTSVVVFALFDRRGRLQRSGELPLTSLATTLPGVPVHAILSPGDAVIATVDIPPVPASRIEAAVQGRVEPMALSELEDLCIAYSRRDASGRVQVSWADRGPLLRGWRLLHDAGLHVQSLIATELALPEGDPTPSKPLTLPVDDRWRAPLPDWSLARPEWRPAQHAQRWRQSIRWAIAAVLAWAVGLHLHAAQLRSEEDRLRQQIETAVLTAFPDIPTLLDPMRQAQAQVDALRQSHGQPVDDAFMRLAMGAADRMAFAAGHVSKLHYHDGQLSLSLAEGYTPDSNTDAGKSTSMGLSETSDLSIQPDPESGNRWHIRRTGDASATRATP